MKSSKGFTLIELLVSLAIMMLIISLVVPRYTNSLDKSREAALRHDLSVMRDALDKFYGDTGKYPHNLQDLVQNGYLKMIPIDPITEQSESWLVEPAPEGSGIFDIKSGAAGIGSDGIPYQKW